MQRSPRFQVTARFAVIIVATLLWPATGAAQDGSIAGRVVDTATGAGIPAVTVRVTGPTVLEQATTTTDATGSYQFANLTPGTYYAATKSSVSVFSNSPVPTNYVDKMFDNLLCIGGCPGELSQPQNATPIEVRSGFTTVVNFTLPVGGRISGTVVNGATGLPLANQAIFVYTRLGIDPNLVNLGGTTTDASGNYLISGLPAGTYYAQVYSDANAGVVSQVYPDIPCMSIGPVTPCLLLPNPGPISVGWGTTTSHIDFQMQPPGSISGTVTSAESGNPLTGVEINVYGQSGGVFGLAATSEFTNGSGQFTISNLAPGTYFVTTATPPGLATSTYVNQIYNGLVCPGPCSWAFETWPQSLITSGTPINVKGGTTAPGIDFALTTGGAIAGTMTTAAGTLPSGGFISVYTVIGGSPVLAGDAYPDATGAWQLSNLASGTYFAFTRTGGVWDDQIYQNFRCSGLCSPVTATSSGTPITVTAGSTTSDIALTVSPTTATPSARSDFNMSVAGYTAHLSWVDTSANGVTLITGYVVEVGSAPGQTTSTISIPWRPGFVDIPGVPPGTYYVRLAARNANGIGAASNEVRVTVNPDGSARPEPPEIAAAQTNGTRVTVAWNDSPSGGVPSSYVVEVGTAAGLTNLGSAVLTSRSFTIEPVPPGVYFARVRARNGAQISAPSGDAMIVVGGVASPPEAPLSLGASVSGSTVTLTWSPPLFGTATSYVLEAGSGPGLADLVVSDLGSTAPTFSISAPPGTYYARVRAVGALGLSAASNEVVIVVP